MIDSRSTHFPLDEPAVTRLLDWFSREGQSYPWGETTDPYAIWVSEVMLQQTTIAAVLPRYRRWMERFPDTVSLAAADESEVLREWEGLGYYNRARNLASAAREIEQRYNGRIPDEAPSLRELPGVGEYIAAAVAGFAFGRREAAIDANGRRIAMRLYAQSEWDKSLDSAFRAAVQTFMPVENPGQLNAGIMQLGQLVCLPRGPRCSVCPIAFRCRAFSQGIQEEIPRRKRSTIIKKSTKIAILVHRQNVLMMQRKKGIGVGMWFFPEKSELDDFSAKSQHLGGLSGYLHCYTRYRETLSPQVYILEDSWSVDVAAAPAEAQWISFSTLEEKPMPSVYRQIARDLIDFLELKQAK